MFKKSLRKVGAAVTAMVMVFAMSVSAFAMSAGSYTATLTGPEGMPHSVQDMVAGDAVVTTDGETDTVTFPLQALEVTSSDGTVVYGTVKNVTCMTSGYTAVMDGANLVVTCPHGTDASDFSAFILFNIERSDAVSHNMPATLTLF